MATMMPMAVATSGDLAGRLVQLRERADDADDRAEQADERRVRAQRPEEGEPPLHADLRGLRRAGDALLGGGGAVFRRREARRGDLRLDRPRRRQAFASGLDVADAQKRE